VYNRRVKELGKIIESAPTVVLRIAKSEVVQTPDFGEQWIQEYDPIEAAFTKWTDNTRLFRDKAGNVTMFPGGEMYAKVKAYAAVGIDLGDEKDLPSITGKAFVFERRVREYQNKEGIDKTKTFWVPVKVYDETGSPASAPAGAKAVGEVDLAAIEKWIVDTAGQKPLPIEEVYKKFTASKKSTVLGLIKNMEKSGKVSIEDGVITSA
jgi:hypothetical protein